MKRILALSFILLLSTVNAISQKNENNCPHKELIRDFVNLADSLSRFMDNTKAAVTDADWERFTRALETGEGEKAFAHLGKLSGVAKETLGELGSQLAAQKQKMYNAVKANDKTTEAELKGIVEEQIYCYFSDTVENNLPKLMTAAGKLAPAEVGMFGGDCEIALRTCLSTASSVHSAGLTSCISLGSSGGSALGWIWGVVSGAVCFINVESTFNNAKLRCARNFMNCMGSN